MTLTLAEKPHPRELPPFCAAALARLNQGEALRIDAMQVAQLPLAWIQALVAASREAEQRGQGVTIINPSFAFLFSFEAIGLQPENGLFTLEYAQ
ncbi:MAG: STAS domain-containing protein [Bosea sp.]|jgi:hypothetical protein|nr:STAS domain-containing protein [Bosea sp. (in: a-proteobacteria)]